MRDHRATTAGLLAVDVDGTLLTDIGVITDTVYKALEQTVSAGWEVVLASGRTFYAARSVIEQLPFLRYAVLSNGACIMDVREERILSMETLSPDVVKTIVTVTRENGAIPALYNTDIYNQKVFYDTVEGACSFFIWYVTNDSRCLRVDDVMGYLHDVLQVGMIAERRIIFAIRKALEGVPARVLALPFESPHFGGKNRDFWFLQVVAEPASKIGALRRIESWLDIPGGRLIAVGDNYNDADMISGADVGVAMGNAPDEIKMLAREVVGSNNGSGLAEAIERIVLNGIYFTDA